MSWEKMLKSGPLRMHLQDSGVKMRVSEQNIDITKFWLFYSATAHEYSIFVIFLLPIAMSKRFSLAMNHWLSC